MAEVAAEPVPLVECADGVMRVRGTGITLDTVLAAFREGATAEQIVQQYPSLALADVYQVIGYALHHSSELAAYLARRREMDRAARELNESTWPWDGIRDRLLARRRVLTPALERHEADPDCAAAKADCPHRHC